MPKKNAMVFRDLPIGARFRFAESKALFIKVAPALFAEAPTKVKATDPQNAVFEVPYKAGPRWKRLIY